MADIQALAAALNDAANRAALCRDIGDYFGATHWEGRCREIDDAMLLADTQPHRVFASTAEAEAAALAEQP